VAENEKSGLVVEPDGNEFAGAILRLLRDPNLRIRLGAAARERIMERFTAAKMAANTLRVYEKVCEERGAR